MSFDEFFSDSDKPYAENLNDGLALADAFDLTVPVKLPDMFNNGEFSSSVNVSRKCGVGIVTLKSSSGVTIGTSSISGTGSVTFRVYPNFNSFYKWNKIVLEKTGTVSVAFKKTDGSDITTTIGDDGTIAETGALKTLQEIDVVLTLTSATISSILIEFVNDQTVGRTRTGALLEASQLANVNGTVSSGETKAVNGGTVYTALTAKEDLSNKVTSLDNSDSHYPTSKAVKTSMDNMSVAIANALDTKQSLSNKVNTLDDSNVHYPTCHAVKTVTDGKANSVHTHTQTETIFTITYHPDNYKNITVVGKYNSAIGMVQIVCTGYLAIQGVLDVEIGTYNTNYAPPCNIDVVLSTDIGLWIQTNGKINLYSADPDMDMSGNVSALINYLL